MYNKLWKVSVTGGLALMMCATNVVASNMGLYLGLQGGYSGTTVDSLPQSLVDQDLTNVVSTIPGSLTQVNGSSITINAITVDAANVTSFVNKTSDEVFAGKIYVGYQFFPNLALEFGYFNFRNISASYDSTLNAATTVTYDGGNVTPVTATVGSDSRKDNIQQYAVDLLVKGIMPLGNGFELYAKLGAALVFTKVHTEIGISNFQNITADGIPYTLASPLGFSTSSTHTGSNSYPEIGVGASYSVSPTFAVDVAYSRIILSQTSNNNINFTSLGIIYSSAALL